MPKAVILLADGTEEMEFTITYDTLVRAGISCASAYVPADAGTDGNLTSPPFARGSRGINILPDMYFSPQDCTPVRNMAASPTTKDLLKLIIDTLKDKYDLIVIPGGAKGAETISSSSPVQHLVRRFLDEGKFVGMICAGSLAAKTSGLPKQPLTSHPSVKSQLEHDFEYSEESVVVSGKLITSRGPGTTFPFALTLVELLCSAEKCKEVAGPMVFPEGTFA